MLDYIYPIFSSWEIIEKITANIARDAFNDIDFEVIPKLLKLPEEIV